MTDAASLKPDFGRFGVWTFGAVEPEQAAEIEKLGYGALWVGGSPAGDLAFVEPILEKTETIQIATGIVNVWTAPAAQVAESYHRIEDAYPGRFVLGVGIGHPEHTDEYRKPYDVLVEYLDALDTACVPTSSFSSPLASLPSRSARRPADVEPVSSAACTSSPGISACSVAKCCSASVSVGAISAAWAPDSTARSIA